MSKKTLYCLIDTETTMKNGLVFDFAFELLDRKMTIYEKGSYLFYDVLAIEEPWYKEKVAQYWSLTYKRYIKPASLRSVRYVFNRIMQQYLKDGYKIILCAYNATFDVTHLGKTSVNILSKQWLEPETKGLKFYDLWHGWVSGCPIEYGWTAPFVHGELAGQPIPNKPGKRYSWNIKTSAEAVYSYLTDDPNFEEKHIAYSDLFIEKVILADILARKKKMHVVNNPKEFISMPWQIAQQRCKGPIEARKVRRQLAMSQIIDMVPDVTAPETPFKGDTPTILFPGNDE